MFLLQEELGRELHQSKAEVGDLRTQTEYLNTQLEVYTVYHSGTSVVSRQLFSIYLRESLL